MKVNVHISGDLATVLGRKHIVELDEGSTVATLASRIAEKKSVTRQGYLGRYRLGGDDLAVLVNGRNIRLLGGVATVLHDGDEVVILPPVAGG
jgi:molybdopterin converting factor small subunit